MGEKLEEGKGNIKTETVIIITSYVNYCSPVVFTV